MSEKSENTSAISEKPLEKDRSEEAAKIPVDVKSTEATETPTVNADAQNNEDQLETSASTEQTKPTNENACDKNDGIDHTESEDVKKSDTTQQTKTDQNLKDSPEPTEIDKPVQNETIQEDAEKVKAESDGNDKSPTTEESNTATASNPEFFVIGDAKSDAEKPADAGDLKLVGDESEDAPKQEPIQIATTGENSVDSKSNEEEEEAKSDAEKPADAGDLKQEGNKAEDVPKEEPNQTAATDKDTVDSKATEEVEEAKSGAEKPADAEDLKPVDDKAEDAPKEEPIQTAATDKDTASPKVTEEVEEAPKEKQSTQDEIQPLQSDKTEDVTTEDTSSPVQSKTEDSAEPAKEEDQKSSTQETSAEIPTQQEEQADKTEDGSPPIQSKTEDSVEPAPAEEENQNPSTQEVREEIPAQQETQETIVQETKQPETFVVEEPESSPVENEVKEPTIDETNQVISQREQPRAETPPETSEVSPAIEVEPDPEITEEAPQETKVSQPITYDGQEMDPDILKLLEKHLEDIGVINYDIKMSPGTESGDNMLGIIAKVQINGIDQNGTNVELHWIIKIAPLDALRKMIRLEALYQNEVLMYQAIFPAYNELEQERSIMHGFNSYPAYLFSSLEYQKEAVAMTDMTSLGYILRNKKEPLDLEHVKVVMKAYGKLHALSYVLRAKRRDIFEQFTNTFRRNLAEAVDVFELKKTQQPIMNKALATLDPIRHTVAYKKFSRYVQNFMGLYVEASRNVNKYSVINHGESCINNMLFKYEKSSDPELPKAVCFLDFQVVRHGSPVCDLSYFLFACTDKSFRDQHYDNAIKLYYYSLCSHLTDMGFDPEKIFPLDVLEAELRRFSVVGLYMTILALATMLGETEEDAYNERLRDVILDFCQKGYLDFLFSKKQSSV